MFMEVLLGFLILTVYICIERIISKSWAIYLNREKDDSKDADVLLEMASQEKAK